MLLASSLGSASVAAAQTCEKPKILVLFDISGSMLAGSPSKYRQAIDGLDAALATLEGRADFGLMLFPKPQKYGNPYGRCNTTTQMEIPFTSFARSTFYNHLNPSGSSYFGGPAGSYDTPISHAFTDVATMTAFSSPSSATYIVLISDGIMDCYPGGPPRDFLTRDWYLSDGYTPNATASGENREAINNIVYSLWWNGVPTYPVGFAGRADPKTLNGIATMAGTERFAGCDPNATSPSDPDNCYYQADTPSQLTTALNQIVQKITSAEVCDGIDNDCDGQTDEGLTRNCTSCNGGTGHEYCVGGSMSACDAPGATAEICDGIDNDCDGAIDENLYRSCGNQYCGGVERCTTGVWGSCNARQPTSETATICDGIDNNCNGTIDDGQTCACSPGQTQPCGQTNDGECALGTRSCVSTGSGYVWGACMGAIGPSPEICDGKDNNCNNATDDGADQACSTACGPGTRACVGGSLSPNCVPNNPPPEVCDGVDNDCDGAVDESSDKSCMTRCGAGTQRCVSGSLQACVPLNLPKEVCDGIDNNCDGQIDEGCGCHHGDERPCGNPNGDCSQGVERCEFGKWSTCIGADNGRVEECNGRDDDCDGMIDEDDNGAICGAGSVCVCGNCATKCDNGVACSNGGQCVQGLCQIDYCPEGQCCKNGACEDGYCELPRTGSAAPQVKQQEPELRNQRGVIRDGCGCKSSDPSSTFGMLLLALFVLAARRRFR
ncbi:MAG: hypothetical protein IT381_10570 [Deltaproteobacteria bacterium]|nr:hypothetical protein [Deltaproteobacteria bacterium]